MRVRQACQVRHERTMIDDSRIKHAIPSWFRFLGWIVFAGSALLFLRLIYEETILTWQNGPQLLLFSIAHIHGTFLAVGGLATLLVYVWLASFPGLATHGMLRKRHIGAAAWVQCGVLIVFALFALRSLSSVAMVHARSSWPGSACSNANGLCSRRKPTLLSKSLPCQRPGSRLAR